MPSNLTSKPNRDRAVAVIIPLLLFQLILLSAQTQSPGGITPIKTLLLSIQGPIMRATSGITGGIRNVWENYIWLVGARSENEKLRESVSRLTILNRSFDEIREENIRLRRLLEIKEGLEYRTLGARVIARAPDFLSSIVYIDRGTVDGVRVDYPVVSKDGIIGRIVSVAGNQSQVQLITNPDASVGAMIEGSRTPGILQGTGDLIMELNYVNNAAQIREGDVILSSGLDKIFPKGLLLGKVIRSRKTSGAFYSIDVEPAADLFHVEEVSVLLMGP